MQDVANRETLLETVRGLRQELQEIIDSLDEERMTRPGSFGEWSFKDLIAHLTGWRLVTAARLEAGQRDEEPVFPWPAHLAEGQEIEDVEGDVDVVNEWLYESNRDKPLDQVLRESNETFDRVERAIATMPEDALLQPGRFEWVYWTDEALGPAVVRGTWSHFHVDHEPDIRAWLAVG